MQTVIYPQSASEDSQGASAADVAFHWLLHLRWGAVAAQLLLVLLVFFVLRIELPYLIIFAILVFEIITNFFFVFLKKKNVPIADWLIALAMFLDTALLTMLLYYSGGPLNPFSFLYLVHITLGAILLHPGWAWGLTGFTLAGYASLFYLPVAGSISQPCHPEPALLSTLSDPMKIHLQGMWVAFAVTAFFIVFFAGRIQRSLAKERETLSALKEEKVKNEKLASLATLAAGAAHEFSTPLSTIAIAAGEMLHTLKAENGSEELIEDATLIRDQVKRCKDILFQMSADAGENLGEELTPFPLEDFLKEILNNFNASAPNQIQFSNEASGLVVQMPLRTMRRIIRGVIKNALDASPDSTPIRVACTHDQRFLYLKITDQGAGMTPETLARASEPFFTTKEPGKGMGLGLYLAKSAAERFGGGVEIVSKPGSGTEVTLFFSLRQIKAKPASVYNGAA
ncbi:ATP-binding protein [Thiovibrio sp. JS02]